MNIACGAAGIVAGALIGYCIASIIILKRRIGELEYRMGCAKREANLAWHRATDQKYRINSLERRIVQLEQKRGESNDKPQNTD